MCRASLHPATQPAPPEGKGVGTHTFQRRTCNCPGNKWLSWDETLSLALTLGSTFKGREVVLPEGAEDAGVFPALAQVHWGFLSQVIGN